MTFGLDEWGQGLLRAFTLFGSGEQVEAGHFALSRFAHLDEAGSLVVARLGEFDVGWVDPWVLLLVIVVGAAAVVVVLNEDFTHTNLAIDSLLGSCLHTAACLLRFAPMCLHCGGWLAWWGHLASVDGVGLLLLCCSCDSNLVWRLCHWAWVALRDRPGSFACAQHGSGSKDVLVHYRWLLSRKLRGILLLIWRFLNTRELWFDRRSDRLGLCLWLLDWLKICWSLTYSVHWHQLHRQLPVQNSLRGLGAENLAHWWLLRH